MARESTPRVARAARTLVALAARKGHAGPPVARERRESTRTRALRALWVPLAGWLLRALAATWRVEVRGEDPFAAPARPLLFALWHESALCAAGTHSDRGVHVAVSQSRDGEHIAAVLARLGFGESPRGSSSRGGAEALRAVLRLLRAGGAVAILVDGPRGPARVAKAGIVAAARLARVPILPVTITARPSLRFASWDRMRLPLPFARVIVHYSEPLSIARDLSETEAEAARRELEARLAG
jgi:lysophospholipid acyltransferase (LPLAT)-like uncharacterized protein